MVLVVSWFATVFMPKLKDSIEISKLGVLMGPLMM